MLRSPSANPFDWTRSLPPVWIAPSWWDDLCRELLSGNGVVLVGGRGLGKSTLLQRLERDLGSESGVAVLRLNAFVADSTILGFLRELSRRLGGAVAPESGARDILAHALASPATSHIVLLVDEVDAFAGVGRAIFDHLEQARRELRGVAVLAAGGVGLALLDGDLLGSPFVQRAKRFVMEPWSTKQILALAAPFHEPAAALDSEALDLLRVCSGGNPALVTFAFQELWAALVKHDAADGAFGVIYRAFATFQQHHRPFLDQVRTAIRRPEVGDGAWRVYALVQAGNGELAQAAMEAAADVPDAEVPMRADRVVELLRAAGLVELRGSAYDDPILLRCVASILADALETNGSTRARAPRPVAETLDARLDLNVAEVCRGIYQTGLDFYKERQLVDEKVFSAVLAIGLSARGWRVEREVQRGGGRIDLLATHPRWPGQEAVVEVKRWQNPDRSTIHQQVLGYWSAATSAGLALTLRSGARDLQDGREDYERDCLSGLSALPFPPPPDLLGAWDVPGVNAEGLPARVRHLLLRVPASR